VVTIGNAQPVIASTSATAGATGGTLAVTASDPEAQPLSYAWTVVSQPTDGNATFASATSATTAVTVSRVGTYVFEVAVSDGTTTVVSSCTMVVDAAATTLTVMPTSLIAEVGETVPCSAQLLDQFGQPMTGVVWSVLPGGPGGTITSLGVYTAPATAGTETIEARAGALVRTIAVTIIVPTTGGGDSSLGGGGGGGGGCGAGGLMGLLGIATALLRLRSRR
jgi:chitinase